MNNPYKLSLSQHSTHGIIAENIGKNVSVLDVGCNDGYIGRTSGESNRFYGLDYAEESVEAAKKSYVDAIRYDLNDLKELPWDIRFDVIIFADVLEHVLYPDAALEFFVKKYLKRGGRVIVSLPNIANWQVRLNLLFGRFDYTEIGIMDRTHLHMYTFKTAKSMVDGCGLEIKKVLGGATFFGPILKLVPTLKGMLATNIILICKHK